jgi:predicted dithiol-disulfide oxidoreductase (DUF899 family)
MKVGTEQEWQAARKELLAAERERAARLMYWHALQSGC